MNGDASKQAPRELQRWWFCVRITAEELLEAQQAQGDTGHGENVELNEWRAFSPVFRFDLI